MIDNPNIRDAVENLMQVSRDFMPGVYAPRTAARDALLSAISAAILAERKACAKVVKDAKQFAPSDGERDLTNMSKRNLLEWADHHIRARPAP